MGESRGVVADTITPLEYLNKLCSYAIALGMSYDQYWYDDPDILNIYVEADEINRRKRSSEMWLQGAYIYQAIGSLVPVLNPFSKEHKAKPYLKEPLPVSEKELEERRLKRIEKWTEYMMSKVKK